MTIPPLLSTRKMEERPTPRKKREIKRDIIFFPGNFNARSFSHFLTFQVLVAQIGNVLGLKDVDRGIDDYRSTASLSYDEFRFYLSKEVSRHFPCYFYLTR